jgi:shikimate kinase
MFSGKSSHGNNLAAAMNRRFLDTDTMLAEQENMSVGEMFEKNGEKWFREREKKLLHSLSSLDNVVISTGGGTPVYNDNMSWMLNNGIVVYLRMDIADIVERIKNAENLNSRPLLNKIKDNNIEKEITEMMSKRSPVYERAHITVSGLSFNVDTVRQAILSL